MRNTLYALACLGVLSTLNGCTTNVQSNPARTATEELLISAAADRAANQLALAVPEDSRVFIDNGNFEGTDSKYAMASIRSHLLEGGMKLVNDRKEADVIIEARAGALSTNRTTFLIGIPQINIPIPFASTPLPTPEIAFYGTEEQQGVAKFALVAYSAKKGGLIATQPPQYGFAHTTKKTLLAFITWTDSNYMPEDAEKEAEEPLPAQKMPPRAAINGKGYAPPQDAATRP